MENKNKYNTFRNRGPLEGLNESQNTKQCLQKNRWWGEKGF